MKTLSTLIATILISIITASAQFTFKTNTMRTYSQIKPQERELKNTVDFESLYIFSNNLSKLKVVTEIETNDYAISIMEVLDDGGMEFNTIVDGMFVDGYVITKE